MFEVEQNRKAGRDWGVNIDLDVLRIGSHVRQGALPKAPGQGGGAGRSPAVAGSTTGAGVDEARPGWERGVVPNDDSPSTNSPPRRRRSTGVVAITGIHGEMARHLVSRLEADDRCGAILLVDQRAPERPIRKGRFVELDLTDPVADARLAEVFRREQVEVLVHLALRESPSPRSAEAHELEGIGTMVVLNAAADMALHGHSLSRVVAVTTAMVYGASARNPLYITEAQALASAATDPFVRDKLDVERQLERFRERYHIPVCVLRPCWLLGGRDSILSRLARMRPPVTVLGFDPLIQLLHADDAADVLHRSVWRGRDGAYNLAAPGVLPLSAVLNHLSGLVAGLPGPLAKLALELNWRLRGAGPGVDVEYLRHPWLVDTARARQRLGFAPRYDARTMLLAPSGSLSNF